MIAAAFSLITVFCVKGALSSSFNYSGTFECDLDRVNDGPLDFEGISPAGTLNESTATLRDREFRMLSYYARTALPRNNSADDHLVDRSPLPTNPFFNSRTDTNAICSRWISRILLGCYNNSDLESIFLDDRTRPFCVPGSLSLSGPCTRDGDYDFVTVNLLQLLYVAKENSGSMSAEVFALIRDKLLTIIGQTTGYTFETFCNFVPNTTLRVEIVDTENHILQIEISRYLTNQLLLEKDPSKIEYNNTRNGNKEWMLNHLSIFLRNYFYEYNSRPYQLFTVKAISILHSYAYEKEVVQAAEMILNIVTEYSSHQMNHLRRFSPFRRQPRFLNKTECWEGDSEVFRLAVLVGNYHMLPGPNYALPASSLEDLRNSFVIVSTIASKYRVNDYILKNFFRENNEAEYFVSKHDVAEIYYSTPNVLISGGGNPDKSEGAKVYFPDIPNILQEGSVLRALLEEIIFSFDTKGQGLTRPTTILPSKAVSLDIRDFMRFEGHKDFKKSYESRNLCVAPGFACGLQFQYGRIIDPIKNECSVLMGNWRFFDFSKNHGSSELCPKYGFYMAVYLGQCIECSTKADNFGLVEISELVDSLPFTSFQQMVIANNPYAFTSSNVHNYKTINGQEIEFQIDPGNDSVSQLLRISKIDGNDFEFNRDLRKWPMLQSGSDLLHSASAVGRWTFDDAERGERYIYDVSDPLKPLYQVYSRPNVTKMFNGPRQYPVEGTYFDDSSSVIAEDSIQSLSFNYDLFFGVVGFRIKWRGTGLQSTHGSMDVSRCWRFCKTVGLDFSIDESIVEVGVGTLRPFFIGKRRVNRVRIVTNRNRVIVAGYGFFEQGRYKALGLNVVAFHGQADEKYIYKLGVVAMS